MVGAGLLLSALLPLASPSPLPTCGERVAGLGLACNSTCACPASTGCVPVPTFAPAAAKCMPTYDDVKVVHVINSCHLDIGFADSSQGIINRYFDHHFPLAAEQGKQFRSGALKGPHP